MTTAMEDRSGTNDRQRKALKFLLCGGIMLFMYALQRVAQHHTSPEVYCGVVVLNIIVDVVCLVLWFRELRKKKLETKV